LSECLVNRQAGRVANLGGEKIRPRKARKTGKLEKTPLNSAKHRAQLSWPRFSEPLLS